MWAIACIVDMGEMIWYNITDVWIYEWGTKVKNCTSAKEQNRARIQNRNFEIVKWTNTIHLYRR